MPTPRKGLYATNKPRLTPPKGMADDVASVFRHIVANVDVDHFSEADRPLLEQYAVSAALATQAATRLAEEGAVNADGKASPWLTVHEKAVRAVVALAARLRLAPQSRFDRLVAGANSRQQPNVRKPWDDSDGLLAEPDDKFFPRG